MKTLWPTADFAWLNSNIALQIGEDIQQQLGVVIMGFNNCYSLYIIVVDILLFNTTSVLLIGHLAETGTVIKELHATISCFLSELSDY